MEEGNTIDFSTGEGGVRLYFLVTESFSSSSMGVRGWMGRKRGIFFEEMILRLVLPTGWVEDIFLWYWKDICIWLGKVLL